MRRMRRNRRRIRIRKRVKGNPSVPRLSIFRSSRHIGVQAVNDEAGRTIASASTYESTLREKLKSYPGNRESAAVVGKAIAERLIQMGVARAVFDRGGNRYHGRVKALAEGAREGGLQF